ncbi:MAG TPA: choice-of-anchor D domain-containing protein, partial [Actinomycetota bacterium]|nr:choice-of-anchor D domain-containing protein [Actinomycetota bacterium]
MAASGILVLFGSNALLALLAAPPAQAASCPAGADTWTGGSSPTAFWGSPSNWSLGFAPTATVQACINSGTPVVTDVFQVAGITMTGGGLSITGGSLEIADTSSPSTVNDLNMSGGVLQADTGPAQLAVTLTGSNTWTAGELAGNVLGASLATSGTDSVFVVDQTASLTVSGPNGSDALLPQIGPGTGLHNNGLLDWNAGFFCVSGDGLINESLGTTEINGTTPDQMIDCNLSGAAVTNNGTVSVTAPLDGGFPAIYNDFTNNGTLAVATALSFGSNFSASATSILAPSLTAAGNGIINLNGGTEAVGGTIQPAMATGFVPSAGEQFQVIGCDGGCTGSYPPTQDGFTVLDSGTSISLEAEPAASPSTTTLTFNPTLVGSGSGPLAVRVTNTGSATLTVTSDGVTGTDAPDFSPSPGGDSCSGATIAPQGSCTVAVDFSPAGAGARAATLQFNDDAPGSPQAVALSGTGVAPAPGLGFSPDPIDFGPVPVGATSEVTETLTNTGTVALYPQFSVTGTDTSPFAMVPGTNCQGSEGGVPPAATCSVALTFTPSGAGPVPADLVVTDGFGAGSWTVPIFATGTAFPVVSLSPSSLTFGSGPVGTPVGPVTVTVTNTGNGTLYFTSPARIGGADPADFSLSSDGCAATASGGVAPGSQCTEHVTFTPQAPGPRSGSLILTDNATGSPQQVTLNGTGTAPGIAFAPNPIAFPATPVGTPATTPLTETLTNSGTAPLIISGATLTGADPGDFGLASNTCSGATVVPAGSCTLVFTFAPTAAGQRAATLRVADNLTGSPQTVPITGSGTLPAATIGPSTLQFPVTTIGMTSGPLVVTVGSSGTAPLTVTAVAISGPDAADFAIASDSCTAGPVSPGASCSIGITFTPTAAGNRTATLAIAGNAPGGNPPVGLSGTGTAAPVPSILLSANPISFPVTPIGNQGPTQVESLTDSGSAPLSITGVAVSGPDQADFAIGSESCRGATLSPGASCTIAVSFTPGGAGPR